MTKQPKTADGIHDLAVHLMERSRSDQHVPPHLLPSIHFDISSLSRNPLQGRAPLDAGKALSEGTCFEVGRLSVAETGASMACASIQALSDRLSHHQSWPNTITSSRTRLSRTTTRSLRLEGSSGDLGLAGSVRRACFSTILDACGHFAPEDQPEQIAALVLDHMEAARQKAS
nr:hypothetical protein [Frigidibacter mobilis]